MNRVGKGKLMMINDDLKILAFEIFRYQNVEIFYVGSVLPT